MILQNDQYKIELTTKKPNTFSGNDILSFDPIGYARSDLKKELYVTVSGKNSNHKMIIIGDYMLNDKHCAVLCKDSLVILLDFCFVEWNLNKMQIEKRTKIDSSGNNFRIYACQNGYLIYGETDISMFNFDFDKIWSFSARDIFVHPDIQNTFMFNEDYIIAIDWFGYYYKLDMNGSLIFQKKLNIVQKTKLGKKKCACCGKYTLPKNSMFEICSHCGWQDDEIQNEQPDFEGGFNKISLNAAKTTYMKKFSKN